HCSVKSTHNLEVVLSSQRFSAQSSAFQPERGSLHQLAMPTVFSQPEFLTSRNNYSLKLYLCKKNIKTLIIMNLKKTIEDDIKKAMLAKDKAKLTALRGIKAAILLAETEKGASSDLNQD